MLPLLQVAVPLVICAFGAGSFATIAYAAREKRKADSRERLFSEKKEAYFGFLSALQKASGDKSGEEDQLELGLWIAKSEIFGPKDLRLAIDAMKHTAPRSRARTAAMELTCAIIRADLLRAI